jgi:hypothetical protein
MKPQPNTCIENGRLGGGLGMKPNIKRLKEGRKWFYSLIAKRISELKERLNSMSDKEYVEFTTLLLLDLTKPMELDLEGFNTPDTCLISCLLFDRNDHYRGDKLTDEQWEWVRRILLKYREQIKELGIDFERIQTSRLAERAVYWTGSTLEGVQVRKVSLTCKGDKGRLEVILRYPETGETNRLFYPLNRKEAVEIARKYYNLPWEEDAPEEFRVDVKGQEAEAIFSKMIEVKQ